MYKLRNKILAHGSDVRTMSVINSNQILTGSRDSSCKVFKREDPFNDFVAVDMVTTDKGKFVNSCKYFNLDNKNYYVVGTGLSVLYVYGDNFELLYTLEGHSKNVSCIDCCYRKNHIASGSWDSTINIWDMNLDGKLIDTLRGHEQAVWCLAYVPGFNLLLSGSADKTIRLWKHYTHVKTFNGHKHAVRDIIVLNDKRTFLSCGNDMDIIKWDIVNGSQLQTIGQHISFVYSLALIDNDNFISAGEDGQVIIWKNMKQFQELKVPCTSVWKINNLNDQEFAVACSDGYIRIYTNDETFTQVLEDEAPPTTTTTTSTQEKNDQSNVSNDKIANARSLEDDPNIPDSSVGLLIPGITEGQVTLVRNQGKVQVYEWSVSDNRWKPFGDVVSDNQAIADAQNISSKVYFEGKEYDYVFDVDLEGQRMLKLSYNNGDDEWDTAQKFLAKHSLSSIYCEQVVNFIKTNATKQTPSAANPKTENPPSTSTNKETYTLHKFKATNTNKVYTKLSEVCTILAIPKEETDKLKSYADTILSSPSNKSTLDNQKFPWVIFYDVINGELPVDTIPFLDLLRVFALDIDFTRKFIQDKQIDKLTQQFFFHNNGNVEAVSMMLILKSFCNMVFLPVNKAHCAFVRFCIENLDSFSCMQNALLWLTQRCHLSLSTLLYNLIVYFYTISNADSNINDGYEFFHLINHCLLEGFRLNECTFDDESLLRLLTTVKILTQIQNYYKLTAEEHEKFREIVQVFASRRPSDTDIYHPDPKISALIVELLIA